MYICIEIHTQTKESCAYINHIQLYMHTNEYYTLLWDSTQNKMEYDLLEMFVYCKRQGNTLKILTKLH